MSSAPSLSSTTTPLRLRRPTRLGKWVLAILGIAFIGCWIIGANFGRTHYGNFVMVENPLLRNVRELDRNPNFKRVEPKAGDSATGSIYIPVSVTSTVNVRGASFDQIDSVHLDDGNELLMIGGTDAIQRSNVKIDTLFFTVFNPKTNRFQDPDTQPKVDNVRAAGTLMLPDYRFVQVTSQAVIVTNLKTGKVKNWCIPEAYLGNNSLCTDANGRKIVRQYREDATGKDIPIKPDWSIGDAAMVLPMSKGRIFIHAGANPNRDAPANMNDYVFNVDNGDWTKLDQLLDGLPDVPGSFGMTTLQLSGYQTLTLLENRNLTVFDGRRQKVLHQIALPQKLDGRYGAVNFQQASRYLVLITPKVVDPNSLMYLFNIKTGKLYSRLVGANGLKQGSLDFKSDENANRQNINRKISPSEAVFKPIDDDRKTYIANIAKSKEILLTGESYRDLPWSFGLFNLVTNRQLNPDYAGAPPRPQDSYAANYNFAGSVKDSVTLSNGSVLFAGPLWFVYKAPKTSFPVWMVDAMFGPRLTEIFNNPVSAINDWQEVVVEKSDESS